MSTLAFYYLGELPHDKTNEMACAPSEDSAQPGHPPSLIRVFQGPNASSCGQASSDQTGRMPRLI